MTRSNQQFFLSLALFIVAWAWAFWPTLQNLESVWRGSDTFMHCYFIPLIALWVCYDKRKQVHWTISPSAKPLLAVAPLIAVWVLGFIADTNVVTHFSSILVLQFALVALLGLPLARQLAFPIFYLIFMVPFGEAFNPILQEITASFCVTLLNWVGVPVYREGLYLTTPAARFEVAVACSGLRFLIASIAIGALFSYLTFRRWYKHIIFMIALLVCSIIANGFRAFFLIWIGESSNMKYGFGPDHFVYGWLFFGAVMFGMFWLGGKFIDPASSNSDVKATNSTIPAKAPVFAVLSLMLLVLWLRHQLPFTVAPATPSAATLPSGFSPVHDSLWQPSFQDGLTRSHGVNAKGVEVFIAQYGYRQVEGELINWGNWLFSTKKWTVKSSKQMKIGEHTYLVQNIVNYQQQQIQLISWYQIGQYDTLSRLAVKLYQVLAVLKQDSGTASIKAVAVHEPLDEQSMLQLKGVLEQIRQHQSPTLYDEPSS